jgi:pimeloyl-ACP methyl ester carboxylesterase
LPDVEGAVRCGTFEVLENRGDPDGRRIGLHVVVLPATGGTRARDAVAFLAGGGVVPATRYAPFFARAFPELRESRDVLLVDQRGTGRSNPLDCVLPEGDDLDDEAVDAALRSCLETLAPRADPRFYTTPHAMDDLDELRARLGYDRLSLWGVSYGTKAARVYLRRHPDRVRSLALHGTVPIRESMWLDLPASERVGLERLFDRCAADESCAAAYPGLRDEYATVLERLRDAPAPGPDVKIDDTRFERMLYGSLRSMRLAGSIPRLIHRAHSGDLSDLTGGPGAGPPPVPRGVYLTISCSEEFARLTPEELASVSSASARVRLERERRDCSIWPRGELPAGYWEPVRSEVPVLLITGADDYITPPAYAEGVAQFLPNATIVVAPDRSHDDFDPCIGRILQGFLIAGKAESLDTSCLEEASSFRFAID